MKSMLDRAMEVEVTDEVGAEWKKNYEDRFTFLDHLFDGRPFRLPPDKTGRGRLSAAIYDAAMVAVDEHWRHRTEIERDKKHVQERMSNATSDQDTLNVLTGQQNTAGGIRDRILIMKGILIER